jgi:hypothetical protein
MRIQTACYTFGVSFTLWATSTKEISTISNMPHHVRELAIILSTIGTGDPAAR